MNKFIIVQSWRALFGLRFFKLEFISVFLRQLTVPTDRDRKIEEYKSTYNMENMDLNEQERNRREALTKLRELGIEPYPAALYPVNATAGKIKEEYDPEKGNLQDVVIAGRIMSRRIMGAASFIELQDESGRIRSFLT